MPATANRPLDALLTEVRKVIVGQPAVLDRLLVALLCRGHVLLEGLPGLAKTRTIRTLADASHLAFRRIQFTPDLLPADITGSSFYRPQEGQFEFREGPVFTNVLLADEINRTSPRTQAALLEVMSEGQVTVEGIRRDLPRPFFVVATQNPVEYHGTYPLPEAQLDRFAIRLTLGYPDAHHELEMLYSQHERHPFDTLTPVLSREEVLEMQEQVRAVKVETAVAEYLLRVVAATRADARLRLAVSPRGSLILYRTAQARARMEGREYVLPEDIRALAVPVLAHRVMLDTRTKYGGILSANIIEDALASVPVPR